MDLEHTLFQSELGPQWKTIGVRHHHGIDVKLSSLHTKQSCGQGEFFDLLPLIDWCAEVGMDVIQLLPLNDTGDDPSPFFAESAMALTPLLLSLHALPGVSEKDLLDFKHLKNAKRVPYHDVQSHKFLFFRKYILKMGTTIVKERGFQEFCKKHSWAKSYALFRVLKDVTQKNHWKTWPIPIKEALTDSLELLMEQYEKPMQFYLILQYLCHQQLTHVKKYANKKGVFLKGDIPILISPDSADVWEYSDEFNLSMSAGAPPDRFTPEGQAWGLPIFNWDVIEKRSYDWWKQRLDVASEYYDLYRIDHILGFFRIFAIEEGKTAKEGAYIPEDRSTWLSHGEKILSALCTHTPMLPIGEDLGDVPDSVRSSLKKMGICGTKVMRWERKSSGDHAFIDPKQYNPVSMTTVSTHDSETLALWWQSQNEEVKAFAKQQGWDYTPKLSKARREQILYDSHHSSSLFHINLFGEYLALCEGLVWDDPFLERINLPGTLSPFNWTYRIRPSVEEILDHPTFTNEVKALL